MASLLKRDRSAEGPSGVQPGFENRPAKRGRPNDSPEEGEVDDDSSVHDAPADDDDDGLGDTEAAPASNSDPNIGGPSMAKKKNPIAFPFKLKPREPEPARQPSENGSSVEDSERGRGWDPRDRQRDDRQRDWNRDFPRRRDFDDRPPRNRPYDRYPPGEDDDWRTRPDEYRPLYRDRTHSPPRHSTSHPQHRHHSRRPSRSRSRSPPSKHRLPVSLSSTLPPPPIHLPSRPLTPSTGPYRSPSDSQSDAPPPFLHRPAFQPFNMPPRLPPPAGRQEAKDPPPLSPDDPPVRPPPAPLPNHVPKSMNLGSVSANGPLGKNVFETDADEGEISDSGAQTVREPELPESDSQTQGKLDALPSKPVAQPPLKGLPTATKEVPINHELEDAIARKIREMEALVDSAPDPPVSQPKQGPSTVSSRVASKVKRSAEQEQEAYGRSFKGCSKLSVYTKDVKLGEGTFGEVFKATHIPTGKKVALKRILMHNESQGFPITAIREIKLLKKLKHKNVVELWDIVVELATEKEKGSIHMVFPYMDHDLAGLLENDSVNLSPSQIKLYMRQLLEGTAYLHRNNIVHRDIKAANLLISNDGTLQIADFGLARPISREWCEKRGYTNCVVTRWYRPPELLLGARKYDGAVDMWGIGCILGEMFERKPILMGESDMAQLDVIFALCGSPTEDNWSGWSQLEGCQGYVVKPNIPRTIAVRFKKHPRETSDLLIALLMLDPSRRVTAEQALDHDYFWTAPLPADPKTMPNWEASKEFDKRRQKELMHHQQQQQQLAQGYQNRPNNMPPNARGPSNGPYNHNHNNRPGHGPSGNQNPNTRHNSRPANPPGLPPPMGYRHPPNRGVVPSQTQPLQPLRWSGTNGLSTAGAPDPNMRNPLPPAPVGLPQPKYGGAEGYNGPLQRGGKHPERPYAAGGSRNPQGGGNQPYGRPAQDSRGPPPRDGRGNASTALPYE